MTLALVFASLTFASAAKICSHALAAAASFSIGGDPVTTTACPRCNAALTAGAQFCGSCGAPQGAAAPPPPIPQPPPYQPPPPMPQIPQMTRGFSGASGGTARQASFAGSPQDAFNQAINALNATTTASNGSITSQVTWQQPPTSAKFETVCKSVWSTLGFSIKYDGDLQVQQVGPGQVSARYNLKVQWGSAMGLILTQGAMVVLAAMVNPYIFAFALILIVGFMGITAWNVSSGMPEKVLTQFIKNLQGGAPAPSFTPQQQYTPPPQPAPQPYTPAPAPTPTPAPTPPPAGAGDSAAIMEQIKQLGSLRDAGVLTADEFEAKKAELLKRI